MDPSAPQKFWTFCGASFAHAPQKVRFLWRTWPGAPQKVSEGGRFKFEKSNVVAHQPGAPQKVDILWRTKLGASQKVDFQIPPPVDRLFSLAEKKRK